jgi:hypothetical protein
MATILSLEYNRAISEQTSFERRPETALKKFVPVPVKKPINFVVKMKGIKRGFWYSGEGRVIPSLFVQTAYKSNAVTLDPVYEGNPQTLSETVIFGSDQRGMYSPESFSWVPYQQVVMVEFDGQRATRMTRITTETFSSYEVRYDRETELVQNSKTVTVIPDCPIGSRSLAIIAPKQLSMINRGRCFTSSNPATRYSRQRDHPTRSQCSSATSCEIVDKLFHCASPS